MPGPTVVALDISYRDPKYFLSFASKSFEEQLEILANKIRASCADLNEKELNTGNQASEWIFAWREGGLTNGLYEGSEDEKDIYYKEDIYLSIEQKNKMLEVMRELTEELSKAYNKKIRIIGGVITDRDIHPPKEQTLPLLETHTETKEQIETKGQTEEAQKNKRKIEKLKGRLENISEYSVENYTHSKKKFSEIMSEDFSILRNTAYLVSFSVSDGKQIKTHDKIEPYHETEAYKPKGKDSVIFRRGAQGGSNSCKIDEIVGVEICSEHGVGIMVKQLAQSHEAPPLIHFILSDSSHFQRKHSPSPYAIHIDSHYKIQLIQNSDITIDPNLAVSLYSCNVLSVDKVELTKVEAYEAYRIKARQREELRDAEDKPIVYEKDTATALFMALEKGNVEAVSALLEKKEVEINNPLKNGLTPLHIAIKKGHVDLVDALLKRGASFTTALTFMSQLPIKEMKDSHLEVINRLLMSTTLTTESSIVVNSLWENIAKPLLNKNDDLTKKLIAYIDKKELSGSDLAKKTFFIEIALLMVSGQLTRDILAAKMDQYKTTGFLHEEKWSMVRSDKKVLITLLCNSFLNLPGTETKKILNKFQSKPLKSSNDPSCSNATLFKPTNKVEPLESSQSQQVIPTKKPNQ